MSQTPVDLIVPGLFRLPTHELDATRLQKTTPILHRLLRFARQQTVKASDFDDILLRRLGLRQAALPWGQAWQGEEAGSAMLFRPVYLKADINNAIVFPVDENNEGIDCLINDLASFFKQDCDIKKLPDGSWSMMLKSVEAVAGMPHYLSALGKKVSHYLQQARIRLDWFKLFNEMQMFLHQHAVNQRRQKNGQMVINSLWCWGADEYHGEKWPDVHWISDEADVAALGRLFGATTHPRSKLRVGVPAGEVIIIDLSILKALKQNPDADLMQLLEKLEQDCFEPLLNSKQAITLYSGSGLNLHYQPRMRWWRWNKPVSLTDLTRVCDHNDGFPSSL